jgi:hypothetical protein
MENNGNYCPAVNLRNAKEAWSYVNSQKMLFPEVRIVDEDDYIILHVINGKIVFVIC